MSRRLDGATVPAVAAVAAVVIAGCGAAAPSSSSSSSSSAAPVAASSSAATTRAATSPVRRRAAPRSHARRSARPAHPPAVATAGLATTAGYGTYELCQGRCTGSVPAALRTALALPGLGGGPCPVTIRVDGPVTDSAGPEVGVTNVIDSRWMSVPVTWTASATYSGPVLIRGGEVGGTGALGFGESATPYDELQLLDGGRGARAAAGARAWSTYTRVRSPGCYAYQVNGSGFAEVIVFRAVG